MEESYFVCLALCQHKGSRPMCPLYLFLPALLTILTISERELNSIFLHREHSTELPPRSNYIQSDLNQNRLKVR